MSELYVTAGDKNVTVRFRVVLFLGMRVFGSSTSNCAVVLCSFFRQIGMVPMPNTEQC